MELKRIVAKDGRRATEQAIALYGPDVLVIANNSIEGQTELIVALPSDLAAPEAQACEVPDPEVAAAGTAPQARASTRAARTADGPSQAASPLAAQDFRAFDEALRQVRQAAPEVAALARKTPPAQASDAPAHRAAPDKSLGDAESLRSREIVDLVRQELAALRQEFKLSRQLSSWESSQPLSPALQPLSRALQEMAVPAALRVLLLDSLGDRSDPQDALQAMHSLLCKALRSEPAAAPQTGVHALCGPSGSGKTVMLARLALAAAAQLPPEQVAMIGYSDARPGAWSQLQLLASQAGVDCFRARDRAALELLLEELSDRRLVLIDTASTDFDTHAQSLRAIAPHIELHAVLPVDASITSVRRVLQASPLPWTSLMLSKLDEAGHPWPLIQGLTESRLPLSVVGQAARPNTAALPFEPERLVQLALAPLQEALTLHLQPGQTDARAALAMTDTARVLGDRRPIERISHG